MKAVQYLKPKFKPTVYTRNAAAETANTNTRTLAFDTDANVKKLRALADGAVTGKAKPASLRPTADWGRKFSDDPDEEPDWTLGVDTFEGTMALRPTDWLLRSADGTLRVVTDAEYRRWYK